ncbi:MAG: winged helix-turn-helix transcriptional regulator [Clostridia bacterium]|nr:winged helix-turn-helix transcriptional regulator [Clostridia bacterium]
MRWPVEQIYVDTAKALKAISDPKRLRIVDMLSCGERCACKILEEFHITQPTLSHDMRVLVDAGLVIGRREGKNTYYALNPEALQSIQQALERIFEAGPDCICHRAKA